ncbi:hypothetical protein [Micromonospora peucetia]|uniref:Uncharacterized protein n=2 Tax=Micromonospora peucetia TaxID=47871 RepID=A0ABZ1ECT6_9ACTN|nr:hypothetical protein [Micromonospora peucetia]WSA32650.1 hypothetical protein OIE14_00730 [Micromonospora peucetia]
MSAELARLADREVSQVGAGVVQGVYEELTDAERHGRFTNTDSPGPRPDTAMARTRASPPVLSLGKLAGPAKRLIERTLLGTSAYRPLRWSHRT